MAERKPKRGHPVSSPATDTKQKLAAERKWRKSEAAPSKTRAKAEKRLVANYEKLTPKQRANMGERTKANYTWAKMKQTTAKKVDTPAKPRGKTGGQRTDPAVTRARDVAQVKNRQEVEQGEYGIQRGKKKKKK